MTLMIQFSQPRIRYAKERAAGRQKQKRSEILNWRNEIIEIQRQWNGNFFSLSSFRRDRKLVEADDVGENVNEKYIYSVDSTSS